MSAALTLLIGISTICAICAFISSFVAHIILQFNIDYDRVREETGQPGWKIFGSVLAPVEFYKEGAKIIWNVQRISLKAFWISLGGITVGMVMAAALGVSVS